MITKVCHYLKNWFDWNQPKFYGKFKIENGTLLSYNDGDMGIVPNQYFRIIGSVFNDGVYKSGEEVLIDETFVGAVWLMAVPKEFIELIKTISDWETKYGDADSINMSPYQSESFGGYSYSKSGAGTDSNNTNASWRSVFSRQLREYKKI